MSDAPPPPRPLFPPRVETLPDPPAPPPPKPAPLPPPAPYPPAAMPPPPALDAATIEQVVAEAFMRRLGSQGFAYGMGRMLVLLEQDVIAALVKALKPAP